VEFKGDGMGLKLLTISRSSWNNNNSTGNTFSSFFEGWENGKIANLYCRSEMPDNYICQKYFSISDAQLLRSIVRPGTTAGRAFILTDVGQSQACEQIKSGPPPLIKPSAEQKRERTVYDFFKIHHLSIFLILHEFVWLLGRWKSTNLNTFLDEFAPDIIFMPAFQSRYAHRLLWYAQKRTNAKIVLFHADDYVTMHQRSWSPFFWINRMLGRRAIKKSIQYSSLNYCISQKQVNEYKEILKTDCKVLYKCGNFSAEAPVKKIEGETIKLVYTGNINGGRWKTLAKIGESLNDINKLGVKAHLDIYTLSPLTNTMKNKLNDGINIFLKGTLTASQVTEVQAAADILVHVESFERKYLLEARLSFSTKIVDYLHQARCIFAVGSQECASIDYILTNDAGIIAVKEDEISAKLQLLINTPTIVNEYGHKAYACGTKNHQSEKIRGMLKDDLFNVMNDLSG
jgi:hypothetical protein